METFNNSLYGTLTNSMNNVTANPFSHNEALETQMINSINLWKQCAKDLYMRSILNPEAHGAKIPSRLPVESAICHLHDSYTFTPNASGKFLLIFDPFTSYARLYNSDDLNGVDTLGQMTQISLQQNQNIIELWRLVSASMILRYIGDFNSLKGLLVCANNSNLTGGDQLYANFNSVEDISNKRVLNTIDGAKMIYSPMDEKATEFYPISSLNDHVCKNAYQMVIIGYNMPPTESFRLDFFRNLEFTTVPAYREYIPMEKALPMDYASPAVASTIGTASNAIIGNTKQSIWSRMVDIAMNKVSPVLTSIMEYGPMVSSFLTKI